MRLIFFTFIGLTIFGTGHTCKFPAIQKKFFIGRWVYCMNYWWSYFLGTRFKKLYWYILSKPLEQSFLSSDIMFFTLMYVVCCKAKVLSFSNFGKVCANNDWSKGIFSLFVSVEANPVYYRFRSPGLCFIWFFGGSSIRLTVSHISFGFLELSAFRWKVDFLDSMVFL